MILGGGLHAKNLDFHLNEFFDKIMKLCENLRRILSEIVGVLWAG